MFPDRERHIIIKCQFLSTDTERYSFCDSRHFISVIMRRLFALSTGHTSKLNWPERYSSCYKRRHNKYIVHNLNRFMFLNKENGLAIIKCPDWNLGNKSATCRSGRQTHFLCKGPMKIFASETLRMSFVLLS